MENAKSLLFFILFLTMNVGIIAQEHFTNDSTHKLYKSDIFLNVGYFGLWTVVSLNAEKQIFRKEGLIMYLRAGVGRLSDIGGRRVEFIVSANTLLGRKGHYFESNLGACALKESGPNADYWPYIFLGYRRQKPGERLLLRMGTGFPDSICIGVGFCF